MFLWYTERSIETLSNDISCKLSKLLLRDPCFASQRSAEHCNVFGIMESTYKKTRTRRHRLGFSRIWSFFILLRNRTTTSTLIFLLRLLKETNSRLSTGPHTQNNMLVFKIFQDEIYDWTDQTRVWLQAPNWIWASERFTYLLEISSAWLLS